MAPLIVISNVYCYTGALHCLNVGSYYSHGRYPDTPGERERVLYADIVSPGQSFHALLYY